MTVSSNSRYAAGRFVRVSLPDGTPSRMLWPAAKKTTGVKYKLYTIKAGDRLDLIAFREYGDASKWWMISDMNPEILWPHDIVDGSTIRIPVRQNISDNETKNASKMFVADI